MQRFSKLTRSRRRTQPASRRQSARAVPDRADGVLIPRPFADPGDQVHYFRRNLADAVIHIPTTNNTFQVDYMPGYSGSGWITLGNAAGDIGNVDVWYTLFTTHFTVDSLASNSDIANTFSEFQLVAVKYSFRTNFGQSALASIGGELPEAWTAAFPMNSTPISAISGLEQLNPKRKFLGPNQVLTHTVAPRAAILDASGINTAYATGPAAWYNVNDAYGTTFNGLQCALRNFNGIAGSGVVVSVRAEAFMKLRRWR